jgi:hypothetical protein
VSSIPSQNAGSGDANVLSGSLTSQSILTGLVGPIISNSREMQGFLASLKFDLGRLALSKSRFIQNASVNLAASQTVVVTH